MGCGSGWLVRRLAALVPNGSVAGIDVSDEMVRRAQLANGAVPNARFLQGTAEAIPAPPDSFTKVLSVESAYYWHDPARGLSEIFRVAAARRLRLDSDQLLSRQSRLSQWQLHFKFPLTCFPPRSGRNISASAGFRDVHHRRIPDLSPTPEVYTGRWFRDAAQMRRFKSGRSPAGHGGEASADVNRPLKFNAADYRCLKRGFLICESSQSCRLRLPPENPGMDEMD